jgi:predicted transcriptional regulator
MTTRDLKKELKSLIDRQNNTKVLQALRVLLVKETPDWWDEISDEERAEIEEGARQAARGELIEHNEVMENPRKW